MGTNSSDEAFARPSAGGTPSVVFQSGAARQRRRPIGTYREPARDIPVYRKTNVLVAGGGPSGTAAAIAAARLGADVTLVERCNHLGGLSTGGLVLWIDRMSDWTGAQVIRGIASDLMDRLPAGGLAGPPPAEWGSRDPERAAYWGQRTAAFHGVVTWSPTIDPEWLKMVSLQMVLDAKVTLLLHSWAVAPIVEDGRVRGAIFESKEGRQAILADIVIDASGDGDLCAASGAAFDTDVKADDIHQCMNTAWLFGGVDMERWIAFRMQEPERFSEFMQRGREKLQFFDRPFVSWRKDIGLFMGPRMSGFSALNVEDLTTVEVESRRLMVGHLEFYREHAPGFENAYLMLSGPQLGTRHSRRLVGAKTVTRQHWNAGVPFEDEIGVSPALSPKFPNVSIPYGCLVPTKVDGILAAGRHISCDATSHSFLREIPQCWATGQAAGVAAALAADKGLRARDVDVREVQRELLKQGAYLRTTQEAALAGAGSPTHEVAAAQ